MSQQLVVMSRDDLQEMLSESVRQGVAAALRDMFRQPGDWLTEQDVADMLGVATATLAVWRCQKKGPAYSKRGRVIMYRRGSVDEWIRRGSVMTEDSLGISGRRGSMGTDGRPCLITGTRSRAGRGEEKC